MALIRKMVHASLQRAQSTLIPLLESKVTRTRSALAPSSAGEDAKRELAAIGCDRVRPEYALVAYSPAPRATIATQTFNPLATACHIPCTCRRLSLVRLQILFAAAGSMHGGLCTLDN